MTRRLLYAVGGMVAGFAVALLLFYLLLEPTAEDLGLLATMLGVTTLVSLSLGFIAYRIGWRHRLPRLAWTMLAGYLFAGVVTFLTVWGNARLMFLSRHDLLLSVALLVFAGGIAMSLGYLVSSSVGDEISRLDTAARELAGGNLSIRVPAEGRDEVASLARSFNTMAEALDEMAQREQELDTLRRELIAWAGHDLRTPLASVRAIVEALADGMIEGPAETEHYLKTARRDIESLSRLIDDLFVLAQLDAGGPPLEAESSSLTDLLSDTIESFTLPAQERGVELSGSAPKAVDPVVMDTRLVARALTNLVSNAVAHTPPGGSVRLTAHLGAPEPDGVEVAMVRVSDTGPGIPPPDLPHIFERYYRGSVRPDGPARREPGQSSGLGLAIAKGIFEAHGGTLAVTSVPGQGATFTATLPRRPRPRP